MASPDHWTVPAALRPKPTDYAYDLDRALAAVVSLSAQIPPDAFTAEVLGTVDVTGDPAEALRRLVASSWRVVHRFSTLLAAAVSGPVETALCPHPAGPPTCWCRPPLPGLLLAFARAHGLDPARSLLIGSRPAHRTLATTLGAVYAPAAAY